MAQKKRPLPATTWLANQADVISPDHKHVYAHTRCWDPTLPMLRWVLLHPWPNPSIVDRCAAISEASGFGGLSIRYLFTLITTNQEQLVDHRQPNGPHANMYLSTLVDQGAEFAPVMAAWKLRGGTSELKSVVGQRVAGLARTDVPLYTPDPNGEVVLSPSQYPTNLQVDGYVPLRYTSEREATFSPPAPRILVTGSRTWTDGVAMRKTLAWAKALFGSDPRATLVEGECPHGGADRLAREVWEDFGLPVEPFPAAVKPDGTVEGPERNARMVDSGAHLCLVYPNNGSRGGTRDCATRAAVAGIPLVMAREWVAST